MKWISLSFLVIVVSCGKSGGGGGEKFGAPLEQAQVGVIASCTTKIQAMDVAKKFDGSFRIINEKKGLVEFIGIDSTNLSDALPRARLTKNKIYENLVENDFASTFALGNFPYMGKANPVYRNETMKKDFSHLVQIDGFDLPANKQGEGVTIAVVDSGVHYNHPHLSPNIRTNPNDPHGQGANNRDEDGNGFTDDYAGWDFYNHDPYPIDDNGHGTHVAGLAAGTVGGVAPRAMILPVKVLGSRGSGDLGTIAAGILYAIQNGADVINLSLGGPGAKEFESEIEELISYIQIAKNKNIMIVAAAGNGGSDGIGDCNDDQPVWPASIESDNLVAVAAVDSANRLTAYSNFGGKSVHVAAPGGDGQEGLFSTVPGNCTTNCNSSHAVYARMSGTSMASPVVSGLVALVKGSNKGMPASEVRDLIMTSGTAKPEFDGLVRSRQVINVRKSIL